MTTPIDAGLTGPIVAVGDRSTPVRMIATTRITSRASSIGSTASERSSSGLVLCDVRSRRARISVCIAMPPRRLPVANARWPPRAAAIVIAISGSVPANPSSSIPPSACPRP